MIMIIWSARFCKSAKGFAALVAFGRQVRSTRPDQSGQAGGSSGRGGSSPELRSKSELRGTDTCRLSSYCAFFIYRMSGPKKCGAPITLLTVERVTTASRTCRMLTSPHLSVIS